jgi:hypothetical protein
MSPTTSSDALSPLTYTVGSPFPATTNPVTSPTRCSLPAGPCRAGTPVTVTVPPSGRGRAARSQAADARTGPPSRSRAAAVDSVSDDRATTSRPRPDPGEPLCFALTVPEQPSR